MATSASGPSVYDLVTLHAAIDGDLCLLKRMASKVNLHEAKDEKGQGVLLLAAGKGHLELCRFLVDELGLDVNCMSAGNCQAVRLVLSKGVDVDLPDYLGTPLLVAIVNGRVQAIKILLEHGADPNKSVGDIYSPLMIACFGHSLKSMKLLVKAGADVNFVAPSGRSILTEATDDGLIDIVKFLLEAGADPNFADKDGKIPIMYAAVNGQRELVEILFPRTRPVPSVPHWSVDGIITSAKDLLFDADAAVVEERIADAKSQGKEAFAKGEYLAAVYFYSLVRSAGCQSASRYIWTPGEPQTKVMDLDDPE